MTNLARAALALFAAALYAQPPAPAPIRIGGVTIIGSIRSRVYFWDWFQPSSGENTYQHSGNIVRLSFSQNRGAWDWNAEFAAPILLGLPDNAAGTGPQQGALGLGANYYAANQASRNAAMIFPKQLFVRFDGLGGNKAHSLQLGRFEFLDGSESISRNATVATLERDRVAQRLIGNFGFSDVGRSFDGLHYAYSAPAGTFTFLTAVPTRGVFQVDGWGWNRIAFSYASYAHQWTGARHSADARLFFIDYDDFRHILKTDNRAVAARSADLQNIRIETFGGHSIHAFETAAGTFDVVLWGALQTGRWGLQQHRAAAADVEAGLQPKAKLKPWIRGGFTYGSGDANPGDNRHGTFFQLLPTPRPYARFPFYNMMNLDDAYGIAIFRPHPKVTIASEFHALQLASADDLWYSGGGAFQPWTFGYTGRAASGRRSLANTYDAGVDYRAGRQLTLSGYIGHAQGRAVMQQIYPAGPNGNFGYVELLRRF